MDENRVIKGRNVLTIKIKSDKSEPLFGLDKIPLEYLYKLALEQIGEQESYIEELEEKVKSLDIERKKIQQEARISINREIDKEAVLEAKKTQHVQSLEKKLAKQDATIKRLYEGRSELMKEIARLRNGSEESTSFIRVNDSCFHEMN